MNHFWNITEKSWIKSQNSNYFKTSITGWHLRILIKGTYFTVDISVSFFQVNLQHVNTRDDQKSWLLLNYTRNKKVIRNIHLSLFQFFFSIYAIALYRDSNFVLQLLFKGIIILWKNLFHESQCSLAIYRGVAVLQHPPYSKTNPEISAQYLTFVLE